MAIKKVNLIIFISCLLSYNLFEANGVKTISVIDVITNDANLCSSKSLVISSKYAANMCNITFPDKLDKGKNNETYNSLYLCVALYDRSLKICNNLQIIGKDPAFNNQTVFNYEVDKIANDSNQILNMCTKMSNDKEHNLAVDKKNHFIEPYMDMVYSTLNQPANCIDTCNPKAGHLYPLCATIYFIDQKIKALQNVSNNKDSNANSNVNNNGNNNVKDNVDKSKVDNKEATKNEKHDDNQQIVPASKNLDGEQTQDAAESEKKPIADGEKPQSTGTDVKNGNQVSQDSTTKNDAPKVNLGNQSKTTVMQKIDKTVDAKSVVENKKEENNDMAIDKPGTIEETPINVDDNIQQHIGADITPEYENDQFAPDYDVKMTEQESLKKDILKSDDEQRMDTSPRFSNMQKDDDSHFFGYFTVLGLIGIGGCLAYHHKQKIFAILLEGRRSRGGRGRRRPSTASYRKLDCTLEEAVTSQCNANVTHVIY